MSSRITIVAEGEGLAESDVRSVLEEIPNLTRLMSEGPDRSIVAGVAAALSFVAEFSGPAAKLADYLIQRRRRRLSGATLKVKLGDMEVTVTNAERSQLIELLDKAKELSEAASGL